MNDEEFATLLTLGNEQRGLEFKGSGQRSDGPLFAQVTRAVLGMSNRRDGGRVVVGVSENSGNLSLVGLSNAELATWTYDDVAARLGEYADPKADFTLEVHEFEGRQYVLLDVREFEEVPVLCKREFTDGPRQILRRGACYVRRRDKIETSEIPSQDEMRELITLAIDKGFRRYLTRAVANGLITLVAAPTAPADAERFAKQLGDLT